jgi:hypothetical protein
LSSSAKNSNSSSNLQTSNKAKLDPFAGLTDSFLSSSQNSLNNSQQTLNSINSNANPQFKTSHSSSSFNNQQQQQQQQQPQQQQPQQKPNYYANTKPATTPTPTTASTKTDLNDRFGEFLEGQLPKKVDTNLPIDKLLQEKNKKEMGPDEAKVYEWKQGKKDNIRALLCSLHNVLWEEDGRWEPVGMHQLITPNEVKKVYRKALLIIHPDRLTGHPKIDLARMIFCELDTAFKQYQLKGEQALY